MLHRNNPLTTQSPLLNQLFYLYKTDKGRNGYSGIYECMFHDKRDKITSMLEIGIGTMIPGMISSMVDFGLEGYKPGGSLRAWRDYFPNANIYGFDIQSDTQFTEERIFTMQGDSRVSEDVDAKLSKYGLRSFDIIIDDGSHKANEQIITLQNFFKYLKPGGMYIIEDVGWGNSGNLSSVKDVVGDLPMFFLGPHNNIIVIANPIINPSELERVRARQFF